MANLRSCEQISSDISSFGCNVSLAAGTWTAGRPRHCATSSVTAYWPAPDPTNGTLGLDIF
jgi:hypothetical protein